MTISRRHLIAGGLTAGTGALIAPWLLRGQRAEAREFPFQLSDAQWKKRLTAEQYAVLRKEGTERPYSSPLNKVKGKGVFHCAACGHPLFSSVTKYESGTGWPSFWKPLSGAVGTDTDYKLGYPRTEVHCARCGGHLGHVFNDGPRPTGKRYCMNGVAMTFALAHARP